MKIVQKNTKSKIGQQPDMETAKNGKKPVSNEFFNKKADSPKNRLDGGVDKNDDAAAYEEKLHKAIESKGKKRSEKLVENILTIEKLNEDLEADQY